MWSRVVTYLTTENPSPNMNFPLCGPRGHCGHCGHCGHLDIKKISKRVERGVGGGSGLLLCTLSENTRPRDHKSASMRLPSASASQPTWLTTMSAPSPNDSVVQNGAGLNLQPQLGHHQRNHLHHGLRRITISEEFDQHLGDGWRVGNIGCVERQMQDVL